MSYTHLSLEECHANKEKAVKMKPEIKLIINGFIEMDWSPEQIAGRLKYDGIIELHHETIYQSSLLVERCTTHLRHQGKPYRKRYGSAHNRTGISNRVDIDQRPEEANNRERVGDWEGDTIIGKNHKGAMMTLDERKSKLRLAVPLSGKKACAVSEAIQRLLQPIKEFVKTITFDNGKEFAHHEEIAKVLECDTVLPKHSWERGQNENANSLLRQYFPKSMELIDVTVKQVVEAIHKLNSRPRKCLGFKTPCEAFEELTEIN